MPRGAAIKVQTVRLLLLFSNDLSSFTKQSHKFLKMPVRKVGKFKSFAVYRQNQAVQNCHVNHKKFI